MTTETSYRVYDLFQRRWLGPARPTVEAARAEAETGSGVYQRATLSPDAEGYARDTQDRLVYPFGRGQGALRWDGA